MKAAISLIALVALVAFGCSATSPWFTFESPYKALNEYLKGNAADETLMANVQATEGLMKSGEIKYRESSDEFKVLVSAFTDLRDGRDRDLCSIDVLQKLRILMEAARNYHKNSPDMDTGVDYLNNLLIILKLQVRARCPEHVKSLWHDLRAGWNHLDQRDIFRYFHAEVWDRLDLFERLIYRHGDTPESVTINDNTIIENMLYQAFLKVDHYVYLSKLTYDQFKDQVLHLLIRPCCEFATNARVAQCAGLDQEILALGMIESPGDKTVSENKKLNPSINLLPEYLISEWVRLKSPDECEGLIRNLYQLFLQHATKEEEMRSARKRDEERRNEAREARRMAREARRKP